MSCRYELWLAFALSSAVACGESAEPDARPGKPECDAASGCGDGSVAPTDSGATTAVCDAASGCGDGAVASTDSGASSRGCDDGTAQGLARCVQSERYLDDLRFIAMERAPASDYWMAVQNRCASTFEALGLEVERHSYGTGVNVLGVKAGTSEPERRVLIGAHYDHIEGCGGADDNSTGVAGVFEAARVLAAREYPRTLVAACWDEEERGLVGSTAYAQREVSAGRSFDVYFNFEMIGYVDDRPGSQQFPGGFDLVFAEVAARLEANQFRGDFIALMADTDARSAVEDFTVAADALGLKREVLLLSDPLRDALPDVRRSDHAPFWDRGIPAIMITDTANFRYAGYHCGDGPDTIERLDIDFATAVTGATVAAAAAALGHP